MKHLFFAVAVATMGLFASCSKDANDVTNDMIEPVKGGVVNITFTDDEPTTKTFFGTTAAAEPWEKSINNMMVYVFKDGRMITLRAFSEAEVTSKQATFPIPGVAAGDQCKVYAVANTIPTIEYISEEDFLEIVEKEVASYNGTFSEVSTGANRSLGFIMSGTANATIVNGTTNVALTLKRSVAKVAIQVSLDDSFNDNYVGAVKVNSIGLSKGATQSYLIDRPSVSSGARTFSFSQNSNVSGTNYQNLFYLYENSASADKVTLNISAVHDLDGDFSTTSDQKAVNYTLGLNGKANGEIVRNGYYRVAVNIKGLTGSDASMNITVADWEVATTQNVDLGN